MRTLLSTLLFSLIAIANISADGIHFQDLSVKKAIKMAAEQDKLVFIDAYTTWCGPCKMMDRETFRDPEVGAFINQNFVSLKIDMESGKGQTMAYSGYVRSYPSYLFINGSGDLVYQSGGYMPADAFLGQARQAIRGAERFKMKDRYEAGERDPAFVFQYITEQKDHISAKKSEKIIREMLESNEDWNNPYLIGMMMYLSDDTDTEVGQFLLANHEQVVEVAGWPVYMSNMTQRFLAAVQEKKKSKKMKRPEPALMQERFVQHIPAAADRFTKYYEMVYAIYKDDLKWIEDVNQSYLSKYESDRASDYKNFAEFLYINSTDEATLELARRHILKAISLSPNWMDNYMTLSAIYDKLGKKDLAEKAKSKGEELAKARGMNIGE